MPISKLRPTFTFDQDRIEQLRALAPEAFADGKINWDVLKEALGENLEDESPNAEHFGLFWPGKREARRFASKPSSGTLIPAPGQGVDEETTHNLFIEGDNLEVLKLLQKSYAGQVKMICIDPPYNTGNDFVYADDYSDSLSNYLSKSGQTNDEGTALTTNKKTDGRFHANWLNMMMPRLRLARNLLRDDGVIFVSIDDNEANHLKLLMDEVFGSENFVALMPWKGRGGGADTHYIMVLHEFVLLYARDKDSYVVGEEISKEGTFPKYDAVKKRNYKIQMARKWGSNSRRIDRPNLFYAVIAPDKKEVYPKLPDGQDGCWRWGKNRMQAEIEEGNLEFVKVNNEWVVYEKIYEPTEDDPKTKKFSSWLDDVGNTANGTDQVKEIFGSSVFSFPKPTMLLKRLMQIANLHDEDIVLDFFSGSSTTAHALMEHSNETKQNLRFIMVQLPTQIDDATYSTIAEIGKERIRRVSKKLKKEKAKGDLGFRVFKLAPSNFKQWRDYDGQDLDGLETQFAQFETPLVDGWTRENLLTEILLQQGFPLDSALTPQKEFTKNEIVAVASPVSAHKLFVCLDEKIHAATIQQLKLAKRDVFICLDAALSSEAKVRLGDATNLVVI